MSIDVKNLQPSEAPKTEVPKKSLQETINEAKKDGKIDQKELQAIQETYNQEKELITLETQEKVKSLLKEVVNWMLKNWLSISRENIYTMTQILENASISFNKEELALIVAENDSITITKDIERLSVYKWWILWSRLWYYNNDLTGKFIPDSSFFDRNLWFNDNWEVALKDNKKDINVAKKEQEKPKIAEKTQEQLKEENYKKAFESVEKLCKEINPKLKVLLKGNQIMIHNWKEAKKINTENLWNDDIITNWLELWKEWEKYSIQISKNLIGTVYSIQTPENQIAKKDEATEALEKLVSNDYVIKKWDTLWKLAKIKWTTVEKIMKENPQIKDKNKIVAWAKIKLPWNSQTA